MEMTPRALQAGRGRRKAAAQRPITAFMSPNKVAEDVQFKVPFLPLTSPEEPTPSAFYTDRPLYAHQQRSLHRMLQIEARDEAVAKFNFGQLDYVSKGGCLADAIGMGKTATMLALIVAEPRDAALGGNLLVAPSHLLEQWRMEVAKFVRPGAIDVIVGLRNYDKALSDGVAISNRTLVLVGVEEAMVSRAFHYQFGQLYPREVGAAGKPLKSVDPMCMLEYTEAAKYVHKAYRGLVWVTSLHIPEKPWRRVIFEEVQDLVLDGKQSQDCFIQLTRRSENVWLITATPFPSKAESIYANNQLLGFKRLRLRPEDPAFDEIKRKLYLRNCAQVKQDAITSKISLVETYIPVVLHPRELLLYKVEHVLSASQCVDIFDLGDDTQAITANGSARSNRSSATPVVTEDSAVPSSTPTNPFWDEQYTCARQSCVHVGISDRIIEREHGQQASSSQGAPSARQQAAARRFALSVKIKSPTEVYRHEQYHLDRQLEVAKRRKNEVEVMELATRNTVDICRAIHQQVYSSVRDCFADMETSGLDKFFDANGETKAGFRMLSAHYKVWGTEIPEPTELIMYDQGEIEDYLLKHFDSQQRIERLLRVMESTLNERCPRARIIVDDQLVQLKECIALQAKVQRDEANANGELHRIPTYGTKIAHLVQYLSRLRSVKVVVFTMWANALRVLQTALETAGLTCAVFLQHQSSETKASHLARFAEGETQVLLLHSLTSASGINLQVASHVIFLDPVGFSAVQGSTLEQQAIGRVLRMGQRNSEVTVVRFVTKDTMEARLFDDIHAVTQKTVAAEDSFFDGERADAYVCDGFDAPAARRYVMRMAAIKGEESAENQDEDEEQIDIVGSMSLEEAINRRVEEAASVGVVFDLTEDADEDFEHQLQAAAAVDAQRPAKRRRMTDGNDLKNEAVLRSPTTLAAVKLERCA
jgi:superfamily II DNA or RNA helicase